MNNTIKTPSSPVVDNVIILYLRNHPVKPYSLITIKYQTPYDQIKLLRHSREQFPKIYHRQCSIHNQI